MMDMRDAFYTEVAALLDSDPRTAVVLADISAAALADTRDAIRTAFSTSASANN